MKINYEKVYFLNHNQVCTVDEKDLRRYDTIEIATKSQFEEYLAERELYYKNKIKQFYKSLKSSSLQKELLTDNVRDVKDLLENIFKEELKE